MSGRDDIREWRRRRQRRGVAIGLAVLSVWVIAGILCLQTCPPWLARAIGGLCGWQVVQQSYSGSTGVDYVYSSNGELTYDGTGEAESVGWVHWDVVITDCRFRDGAISAQFDPWDVRIQGVQYEFKVHADGDGVSKEGLEAFARRAGLRVSMTTLVELAELHRDLQVDWSAGTVRGDRRVYEAMTVKVWQVVWVAMPWVVVAVIGGSVVGLVALVVVPRWVQWHRQRGGRCPRCGYAGQAGVCPECGLVGAFGGGDRDRLRTSQEEA